LKTAQKLKALEGATFLWSTGQAFASAPKSIPFEVVENQESAHRAERVLEEEDEDPL
jgi:hypothetical protein